MRLDTETTTDDLELPASLRVENRKPAEKVKKVVMKAKTKTKVAPKAPAKKAKAEQTKRRADGLLKDPPQRSSLTLSYASRAHRMRNCARR